MMREAAELNSQRPQSRPWRPVSRRRLLFLARERAIEWGRVDLGRLGIWTPVAIGVGAGLYFSLKAEPPWQIGFFTLIATLLAAFLGQRWRGLAMTAALAALGFVAADWRTSQVRAPVLDRDIGIVEISGRLVSIEESPSSRRMIIELDFVEGLGEGDTPARARITWRGKEFSAAPGDRITLRAGLGPPPPPVAPGAFDFARRLYFQRIGAVGFAVSAPIVDAAAQRAGPQELSARIETLRFNLFRRIVEKAPGRGGAIVAAIVTGKRDAISEGAKTALRDTGLAHLLAISGLHMGLATGLIFFIIRLGLALIEPLALKYPIKKWAAAAALLSGFCYLILSGGGWSARRAFIMAAIMFTAIIFDRRALSLRNVAVAAAIILLTTPEAIFHPGFQMSFAAVTALIAMYEWWGLRADPYRSFSWTSRLKRYVVGLAATDSVAAIATAPFALYHFNRIALFSLPANIAAMPMMGFWIVPAAVLALILTPFGLDGWAWRLSAAGMEAVLAIASEVSGWRGAVSVTPQWPHSALLALTAGGLWLCLLRAPWRLAGFLAVPAAAILIMRSAPPTVFVAPSGLNAGIVTPSGEVMVYSKRRDRFAVGIWKEIAGLDPAVAPTIPMRDAVACDKNGCVADIGEARLLTAFISERRALGEDCARANLVIAFFPVTSADWHACKATLIDRRAIWRRGAHAIWVGDDGKLEVKTASEARGRRPWAGD